MATTSKVKRLIIDVRTDLNKEELLLAFVDQLTYLKRVGALDLAAITKIQEYD